CSAWGVWPPRPDRHRPAPRRRSPAATTRSSLRRSESRRSMFPTF
ncbi:MAG: hypothetical protein AVDCRST_MAG02-3975, partial [uncultured Rubrobacteraceae bacterium]